VGEDVPLGTIDGLKERVTRRGKGGYKRDIERSEPT
jgi:hypothetical protein